MVSSTVNCKYLLYVVRLYEHTRFFLLSIGNCAKVVTVFTESKRKRRKNYSMMEKKLWGESSSNQIWIQVLLWLICWPRSLPNDRTPFSCPSIVPDFESSLKAGWAHFFHIVRQCTCNALHSQIFGFTLHRTVYPGTNLLHCSER